MFFRNEWELSVFCFLQFSQENFVNELFTIFSAIEQSFNGGGRYMYMCKAILNYSFLKKKVQLFFFISSETNENCLFQVFLWCSSMFSVLCRWCWSLPGGLFVCPRQLIHTVRPLSFPWYIRKPDIAQRQFQDIFYGQIFIVQFQKIFGSLWYFPIIFQEIFAGQIQSSPCIYRSIFLNVQTPR